jgi:hypothetical protein
MKKFLLILILTLTSLPATQTGKQIFKKYCVSCHIKTDIGARNKKKLRHAPPMNRVSQRLKIFTNSKEEFITFAKEYIQNPSQKKGLCRPKAYKRFGVMPPIGKSMTQKEREIIVEWLYIYFDASKEKKASCATEDMRGSGSKCGGGKCGARKCGGQ